MILLGLIMVPKLTHIRAPVPPSARLPGASSSPPPAPITNPFTKDEPMTDHIPSQSDDRTANNAVRHTYRVLSDAEKQSMVRLKDLGAAFIAACDEIGQSREMSLAKTNAEQAVMWAVKHVTA